MTSTLAAIAFDPTVRGILVVATGVIVLIGSIYLIVSTNTGFRLGLLITLAGLTGWCFSMGMIWWVYGIGLRGADPSWINQEINFTRDDPVLSPVLAKLPRTEDLPDPQKMYADYVAKHHDVQRKIEASEGQGYVPETLTKLVTLIPELKPEIDAQLNGWRILPESDSRRGDAVAASDAFLLGKEAFGQQTSSGSYTTEDVFFYGGKGAAEPPTTPDQYNKLQQAVRRVQSALELKNPPLYAAVTLQKNVEQTVAPGEAPPPAVIDENAAIVTTLMERNLGSRRLVPATFAILMGILFACFATMLHFRDKRAMKARADWKPTKAG